MFKNAPVLPCEISDEMRNVLTAETRKGFSCSLVHFHFFVSSSTYFPLIRLFFVTIVTNQYAAQSTVR